MSTQIDCICEERDCVCEPEQLAALDNFIGAFRKCQNCDEFFELSGQPDEDDRRFCDRACDRSFFGLDGRSE